MSAGLPLPLCSGWRMEFLYRVGNSSASKERDASNANGSASVSTPFLRTDDGMPSSPTDFLGLSCLMMIPRMRSVDTDRKRKQLSTWLFTFELGVCCCCCCCCASISFRMRRIFSVK